MKIFFSSKYPLWVLWTCVSRCLKTCKRPEINPFTVARENGQKLHKNGQTAKIAILGHILDFFSAYCGRINFPSFACCQAPRDTSLEYPQRVLWRKKYFHFIQGSWNFARQNRKPKWLKKIILTPDSYLEHIYTWKFARNGIRNDILGFSTRLSIHVIMYTVPMNGFATKNRQGSKCWSTLFDTQ